MKLKKILFIILLVLLLTPYASSAETKKVEDYSLNDFLRNYSVITLGQNSYAPDTKLGNTSVDKGSARIFHIAGQFLINGDFSYPTCPGGYSDCYARVDYKYLDYGSHSFLKGNLKAKVYQHIWDNYDSSPNISKYRNSNQRLYLNSKHIKTYSGTGCYKEGWNFSTQSCLYATYSYTEAYKNTETDNTIQQYNYIEINDNFLDFGKLKEHIVSEAKKIEKGTKIEKNSDGNLVFEIGNKYTVDNISNVKSIYFNNFSENIDKLTVITILDEGRINFPNIYVQPNSLTTATTNDWYNKQSITYTGEKYYGPDTYHGNIVWYFPNATYIQFPYTAFIGHVIAPNADVEFPETNFAGVVIANSLYADKKAEAHFYPLTTDEILAKDIPDEEETPNESNKPQEPNKTEITNPKTGFNRMLLLTVIFSVLVGLKVIRIKRKPNI